MKLTSKNVSEIFEDCMFREDELVDGHPEPPMIEVEGILAKFGLHKGRIEAHTPEIVDLLTQLPPQFRESTGGGWTFLNACHTAEGEQWGEHRNMEQLFVLGIAAGKARWCMPKDMWKVLPGGMPYVVCSV